MFLPTVGLHPMSGPWEVVFVPLPEGVQDAVPEPALEPDRHYFAIDSVVGGADFLVNA